MWCAALLVASIAVAVSAAACAANDGECSTETRSNSLLQMPSVRGISKAALAADDAADAEDQQDTLLQPCTGPLCGSAYAVPDSKLLSKSSSNSWGAHLQTEDAHADVLHRGSVHRLRMHTAYVRYLDRTMYDLDANRNASVGELDKLIQQFIDAHVASTDHCPAELMEAKHQLNSLHQQIKDLADEVKTIEDSIKADEDKKKRAHDDIDKLKKEHGEDKDKAADEREEARKFLQTLRKEMAEMKKIAQPDVTMNISSGTIGKSGGPMSLVEAPPSGAEVQKTQEMVSRTQKASSELLMCMQQATVSMPENKQQAGLLQAGVAMEDNNFMKPNCSANMSMQVTVGNLTTMMRSPAMVANDTYRSYHCSHVDNSYGGTIWLHCVNGKLTADSRGCIKFPNQAACESQRKALQETYVKAYVGLARLIDQYEKKVADTSKDDAAKKQYDDKADPKKKEASDLADDIAKKTKQLQELREKLKDAWSAEKKLRQHIENLKKECSQLGNTTQYLKSVRDAIHALEACPGLERPEFHIPLYEGAWVNFTLDPTKTTAQNDMEMKKACEATFGAGSRPAEVSEIEGQTIEAAPLTNTAMVPLLGACPECEGGKNEDTGSTSVDGHARICWYPGKTLDLKSRMDNCYQNMKAVMCVSERGDMRKMSNFITTAAPTTTQRRAQRVR